MLNKYFWISKKRWLKKYMGYKKIKMFTLGLCESVQKSHKSV